MLFDAARRGGQPTHDEGVDEKERTETEDEAEAQIRPDRADANDDAHGDKPCHAEGAFEPPLFVE
ncbi:MAG: hypothetical protein ACYC9W_03465 [Candidatus Limnocylindria bacterium]